MKVQIPVKTAAMISALIACCGSAGAMADVLSQTQNFSFSQLTTPSPDGTHSNASITNSLGFLQFNSSLGTLTGVSLTYNSTGSGAAHQTLNNSINHYTITGSATFSFLSSLLSPTPVTVGNLSASGTINCSPPCPPPQHIDPSFSQVLNGSLGIASLAPFVGTGSLSIGQELVVYVSNGLQLPPFAYLSADAAWNGSATLAYTYTAAIPEPETYAMLLAGLGLLGFTARRKKQNAA
jgi:hypothetical protein